MQDLTVAEAEEKSRLMSRLDEANLTNQQLSADCEAKRVEVDSLATELQQLKLTLEVCRKLFCIFLFLLTVCCFDAVFGRQQWHIVTRLTNSQVLRSLYWTGLT